MLAGERAVVRAFPDALQILVSQRWRTLGQVVLAMSQQDPDQRIAPNMEHASSLTRRHSFAPWLVASSCRPRAVSTTLPLFAPTSCRASTTASGVMRQRPVVALRSELSITKALLYVRHLHLERDADLPSSSTNAELVSRTQRDLRHGIAPTPRDLSMHIACG